MAKMGLFYSYDRSSDRIWIFEPTFGMLNFLIGSGAGSNWSPYQYIRSCTVELLEDQIRFTFRKSWTVLIIGALLIFSATASMRFGVPIWALAMICIFAGIIALHYFWSIDRIKSEAIASVRSS